MIGLAVSAELEGVTDFIFQDSPEDPFEFTFEIQCTKCREKHDKPVRINQYETHEIQGSRGEANFVFRCNFCKSASNVTMKPTGKMYKFEDQPDQLPKGTKFKPVVLLELDSRGIEFVKFEPVGKWHCKGLESGHQFDDVEVEDGEWYDYDEKAGNEVSITNIEWSFVKL